MAIIFCDGFDHYDDLLLKWDSTYYYNGTMAINAAYGRNSTAGIAIGKSRAWLQKSFTTGPQAVACAGVAFNPTAGMDQGNAILLSFMAGTYCLCGVAISPTLQLFAFTGRDTTNTINTPPNIASILGYASEPVRTGTFQYIELEVSAFDAVSGALKVYYNGAEVLSLTGVDTAASVGYTAAEAVRIGGHSTYDTAIFSYPGLIYFDDFYLTDGTDDSGAGNTGHLGDVRIEELLPNADSTYDDWIPLNAGDHYAEVDENPPDDDTTYVASRTVGDKDTYTFPSVTPTYGTVKGVAVNFHVTKVDAGSRRMAAIGRYDSTDDDGTDFSVGTGYAVYQSYMEKAPNGTAWTIAKVNASEFGPKLTE